MRAKFTLISVFILLYPFKAEAQQHVINYNSAISQAEKCYADSNWNCADQNFRLAQRIAFENNMSTVKAKSGIQKVLDARERQKYNIADLKKALSDAKKIGFAAPPGIELRGVVTDTINKEKETESVPVNKVAVNNASNSPLIFPNNFFPSVLPSKEKLQADIQNMLSAFSAQKVSSKTKKSSDVEEIESIEEMRLQGENRIADARFLYDSTLSAITRSGKVTEQLLWIHLRAALHHIWNLMDQSNLKHEMLDSARMALQQTTYIASNHAFNSAKINFGYGGFENLLSAYYTEISDSKNSFLHKILAADYLKKAVSAEPANPYYLGSLVIYLRNFKFLPDSVLPENEKMKFASSGCDLINHMLKNLDPGVTINNSIVLVNKLQCITDDYYKLTEIKEYQKALPLVNQALTDLKKTRWLTDNSEYGGLLTANIYNRISYLHYALKDSALSKEYTQKAVATFISALKNSNLSHYRWQFRIETAYDDIVFGADRSYSWKEKIALYNAVIEAITSGRNDYFRNKSISYVFADASKILAGMLLLTETKIDSLKACDHLANSIELFERGQLLDNYTGYSEDYEKFGTMYKEAIQIYVAQRNYTMARKYYESMMKYFTPVIDKYRYDFYLIQRIARASESYGEYTYAAKKYKEAIQPLEFASFEGIKKSTEYLVEIYKNASTGLADKARLNALLKRKSYQLGVMKKFTLPTQFGNTSTPFTVYVVDRDPDYPYKGINDQVEWIKKARGGIIARETIESFEKLQEIAWKNSVSFTELCAYALDGSSKDTKKISPNNNISEIDFSLKKNTAATLAKGKTVEQLNGCLGRYLEMNDKSRADSIVIAILSLQDNPKTRDEISYTYWINTGDYNFNKLFLSGKEKINDYRRYFMDKDLTSSLLTNSMKRVHYYNLVELDEAYLHTKAGSDSKIVKKEVSQHYNSLGWFSLLSKKFDSLAYYFNKSIEYDVTNLYPYGNLPHTYLFNNEPEKAKSHYLKLKDKPFDKEAGFPTFKDAFLADFKDFEKAGITNDHIEEIIQLLNTK